MSESTDLAGKMSSAHFRCWTRPAGTVDWWGEFDIPGGPAGVFGLPLETLRTVRPDWIPANGLPATSPEKIATERTKIAGYIEASKIADASERASRMWAIFRESVLPMLGFVFPPFAGVTLIAAGLNSYAAFAGPDNATRKLFVDAGTGAVKAADEAVISGGSAAAGMVVKGAGGLGIALLAAVAGGFVWFKYLR